MRVDLSIAEAHDPTETVSWQVKPIVDESGLAALAADWDALAGDVPFRTWNWMSTWWRHYRTPHARLLTLAVYDDSGLIGVAPWYVSRVAPGVEVVRFLGSGEVCSDYQTLLCRPGCQRPVAAAIFDWLTTEGAENWDLLDLSGVEADDMEVGELCRQFVERGYGVRQRADASCWRTALPATWNAFLATLSKSRRERTRSLLRRTFAAGRAQLHVVETAEQLEQAFALLIELHQKRRQSLRQPGCFSSPRFTAFHREVAAALLACGRLRMLWTELDGQPLAVEYSFTGGATVYYYQGGFDPALADERPGWLTFAASLERAIAESYDSYDFLRGDEPYKASWGAVRRPLVRLRIVGQGRAARLFDAAWQTQQTFLCWTRGAQGWIRPKLSRKKASPSSSAE